MKTIGRKVIALLISVILIYGSLTAGYGAEKECSYVYNDVMSKILTEVCSMFYVEEDMISAPKNITAKTDSHNQLIISWDVKKGASSYVVYKAENKNGEFVKIGDTKKARFIDKNVANGKRYCYKVRALGGKLGIAGSKVSKIATGYTKLPAVSKLSSGFDASTKKVKLTWTSVEGASKYYVYKKTWSGSLSRIGTTSKTNFSTPITWNGTYIYVVAPVGNAGGKEMIGLLSKETKIKVSGIPEISSNRKKIALTFDDGPGPYTKAIVDCLNANNSKATFFVLGSRVSSYSGVLSYTYSSGHEIANHSYSHPMLTGLNGDGIKAQMNNTDAAVKKITGATPKLMRPPGGAINDKVRNNVGKPMINWSIDTLDWKTRSKTATINAVMNNVREGDIILMHDIHRPTMEAVLELVPILRSEGYDLVTVSELAKTKGYTLSKGCLYTSLR